MQELIEHNRALLEHQRHVMALIPKQLKVDSTMLQRAHSVEERVRKEEAERRSRDVRAAEASAAVELESVKQRLETRVAEQEKLIKEMTQEAAAYHGKRRQQITVGARVCACLVPSLACGPLSAGVCVASPASCAGADCADSLPPWHACADRSTGGRSRRWQSECEGEACRQQHACRVVLTGLWLALPYARRTVTSAT